MKRCPQCEFIYEDEQSLCDMDGVLLVFDSRNLPNSQALAPVSGGPAPRAQKRNRTVPVFASLILALVLGGVYYVTTQRPGATIPPVITQSAALPGMAPAPPLPPAEVDQLATESSSPEKEEPKPEVTKPARNAPAKKSTTRTTVATQTKAPAEEKKDGSKVGSILKKTGRILKKPFKL